VIDSWTSAYIATSSLLGEPLDATLASIERAAGGESEAPERAALPAAAAALASTLRSTSREIRAQALARALSEVALALDAVRLA
jgi:hypothetical protein